MTTPTFPLINQSFNALTAVQHANTHQRAIVMIDGIELAIMPDAMVKELVHFLDKRMSHLTDVQMATLIRCSKPGAKTSYKTVASIRSKAKKKRDLQMVRH